MNSAIKIPENSTRFALLGPFVPNFVTFGVVTQQKSPKMSTLLKTYKVALYRSYKRPRRVEILYSKSMKIVAGFFGLGLSQGYYPADGTYPADPAYPADSYPAAASYDRKCFRIFFLLKC